MWVEQRTQLEAVRDQAVRDYKALQEVANPDDTGRIVTKSAHTSETHQEFENEIGSQGLSLDGDISPETDIKRSSGQTFNKVSTTELYGCMEHVTAK